MYSSRTKNWFQTQPRFTLWSGTELPASSSFSFLAGVPRRPWGRRTKVQKTTESKCNWCFIVQHWDVSKNQSLSFSSEVCSEAPRERERERGGYRREEMRLRLMSLQTASCLSRTVGHLHHSLCWGLWRSNELRVSVISQPNWCCRKGHRKYRRKKRWRTHKGHRVMTVSKSPVKTRVLMKYYRRAESKL